jgi:ribonuclease HI
MPRISKAVVFMQWICNRNETPGGGSSAVVTSGNTGNPTFLDVRHQYRPEYTTSLEIEMWGLWLALDCLDDEAVAAGVLICSDSQWALNAIKESGHSVHSVLAPLRARLRGLKGCVCFQWVPAREREGG